MYKLNTTLTCTPSVSRHYIHFIRHLCSVLYIAFVVTINDHFNVHSREYEMVIDCRSCSCAFAMTAPPHNTPVVSMCWLDKSLPLCLIRHSSSYTKTLVWHALCSLTFLTPLYIIPIFPLYADLRSTHNLCKSRRYSSWYLYSIQTLNLINLLSCLFTIPPSTTYPRNLHFLCP